MGESVALVISWVLWHLTVPSAAPENLVWTWHVWLHGWVSGTNCSLGTVKFSLIGVLAPARL